MSKPVNFWYVAAIVMPILVSCTIYQGYQFGWGTPYQLEQIGDVLTNVQTTSNIDQKIAILQQVSDKLSTWHGNPQYWYPTQYEDLDLTKASIDQTIQNINTLKKDPNSMAYQQSVANLDSSTSALQNRIGHIAGTYGMNPTINPVGWGLFLSCFVMIPLLIVFDRISQKIHLEAYQSERKRNYGY